MNSILIYSLLLQLLQRKILSFYSIFFLKKRTIICFAPKKSIHLIVKPLHMASTTDDDKCKNGAAPDLHDCANCGASEGSVPGSPVHKACKRCMITYYCGVPCQTAHWKRGGHRQRCRAPEDRSVVRAAAEPDQDDAKLTEHHRKCGDKCPICLEDLDDDEFGDAQILPCTHRFHKACIKELRRAGVQQACPMCRAQLPPSPEKMFADGFTIFFPMKKRVEEQDGPWRPLSRRQQQQMKEVLRLWEKAADQGYALAQYNLGLMYHSGRCVEKNHKKAFEWFEKAAEQGHVEAQHNLGTKYLDGKGVDQNVKKAVELFEKAAERGLAEAQYNLGGMYDAGVGVDQSDAMATRWFAKAAAQGIEYAQFNMGIRYDTGRGVEKNYKKAFEWFEKAAEQGHTEAQHNMGNMYENGQGVEKNYKKACEWYEKAADQGLAEAQFNLGNMYHTGRGVKKNYKKACEWYEKAAEQGVVDAQLNLGISYDNGRGVKKNDKKAFEWFEQAAEQGNAGAQYNLGIMYDKGQGVDQSDAMAMRWFGRAAIQGEEDAQERINAIIARRRTYGNKKEREGV